MTRTRCLAPLTLVAVLLLTACGSTTQPQAESVLGTTATNLESSAGQAALAGAVAEADLYAEAAAILRALPLAGMADANGNIPLIALQKSIAAATGGNTELATVIAGALTETLTQQGVPPSQIAWWVGGVSILTLILRKVLPMAVAGGSGTPVGAVINTLFGLFWSHSTWDKRTNGKAPPATG